MRRYALLAVCKEWKNFKSMLTKNYVEKNLTPFQKYPFVEEYWEDFVAKKTTDDFRSESEAHRAIQAKNTHPTDSAPLGMRVNSRNGGIRTSMQDGWTPPHHLPRSLMSAPNSGYERGYLPHLWGPSSFQTP